MITAVMGLGHTGWSVIRYLAKANQAMVVLDSRIHPPFLESLQANYPNIPYFVGPTAVQDLSPSLKDQITQVIVSPGIAKESFLLEPFKHLKIIGDIELFAQAVKQTPIIAITGSNGKSTVTSLLGEMVKQAGLQVGIGGNLGLPALDLIQENQQVYILELSSFQLETTYSLNAHHAVILNISADHLDRYSSLQEYIVAKERIFHNANFCLKNREDNLVASLFQKRSAQASFGYSKPLLDTEYGMDEYYLMKGNSKLFPIELLKIYGKHNQLNALVAIALAQSIQLPQEAIFAALESFTGLEHRSQWIGKYQGLNWYNDSKGTNIGATKAALQGFSGKVVLIAGGEGKDADFYELSNTIKEKTKVVILIGRDAQLIGKIWQQVTTIEYANDMEEAVIKAAALAEKEDSVLLSPACASFDMFNNYMHRGEVFTQAVKRLYS